MNGEIECKCGNRIIVMGSVAGENFDIRVEGGTLEKKGEELVVLCEKCGKEAGKIEFHRGVPEKAD
jgi:hypothetical protein